MNPYQLVFGHPSFEEKRFPTIAEELEARHTVADDPDSFALLRPVEDIVAILGPEGEGGPRGEVYRAHARLLYHAFLFWRAGHPADALGRQDSRALAHAQPEGVEGRPEIEAPDGVAAAVADEPDGVAGETEAPDGVAAGWVELPSTLFWALVPPATIPEPVNGFFWAAPKGELQVLYVTGMRADRAGFGTLDARGSWGSEGFAESFAPRPDGTPPFANLLPGGELDGLLSIATRGEALTLAARALRFLRPVPEGSDLGGSRSSA